MAKFTLICEHSEYDDFTGDVIGTAQKITHEFREENLGQIIENFEMFLRGSGFHINGTLDTITEEHIEDDGWEFNTQDDSEKINVRMDDYFESIRDVPPKDNGKM